MISDKELEKIRADFPILTRGISGKPVIYFDSACMSLRPQQVIRAMDEYYEEYPACAGRSIHKLGKRATDKVGKQGEQWQSLLAQRKQRR